MINHLINFKYYKVLILNIILISFSCNLIKANGFPNVTITPVVASLVSNDHTSEGFMVTLNSGRIIHFFRLDPGTNGNHIGNHGRIMKRYSDDNGQIWSQNILVYDDQFDDRNINGGILSNGRIILTFRRINVFYYPNYQHLNYNVIYSDDDGITWSSPLIINTLGVCSDTHKIIYVPTKGYMNEIMNNNYVEIRFSNDGVDWSNLGYVWNYTVTNTFPISEACFAYSKDGKLIGLMRNSNGNYYQVSSSDYGTTWTQPKITNMANGYFCPSPLIFYDKIHDDMWAIATDRRGGDVGLNLANCKNKIWIYVNKVDSVINNPTNWKLVDTLSRPIPSGYRLYGYACETQKLNGNHLIVFTESCTGTHEYATLFQFEINYNDISTQVLSNSYFSSKQISQNYPNPVKGETTIEYYIPESQLNNSVIINFYNEIGALVYSYSDLHPTTGKNNFNLNTSLFKRGIYFYGFENSPIKDRMKMLVLN